MKPGRLCDSTPSTNHKAREEDTDEDLFFRPVGRRRVGRGRLR